MCVIVFVSVCSQASRSRATLSCDSSYLFISHFGFKSGIWLLIAPVLFYCFSITFNLMMTLCLQEMKDASSQVGDSAFGPKITDANPTMGEIFNDSNHVRSEVNSASQEPSSIEIDSFTLNDQKDPAIQCDSFHQNNSFTQRVNFDPAENRTYHKGSPFSEDCANHSDNFDKSLHFFPHKVSQFGKDSFTYNDNFDQTVNTIPQKASPFANNYVLHSDNFDKSVHFAPHNVLQFGKDSITHKDSCDQTLNSIPQKASTFAQDSVFHNDNIDQSLNRTPYLRFLEKPANCSANFDHAMSAHQKASPFGKDIVAQCDNFDQQVNSAPMRTEPFEKDTDIHCDNFDQQVNSAPQRTQPFEKDTDIHCDHIDQAAESDKPLDNNISMPREKSIQVICQPVEINGKIVDRDIIGKSRFTGLVEDIRSVQNSQAIQDSATSEIVVKQEISEPERLKEYRFIQNSGIIKEILTNKEDKSSPEWPLESTRPIEDRGTDARSVTNELFVKQEESHTDRLVEEIKSTQNTVEEYVRSKIVVKHEESNTIEISPVEPEITANSIIDKEKQSHKERPVNEIGSIQNTGTVEGCIVSDVVKEENGETDSIAENVRSKQNAALIRESVASEVVIKQEKSDDKEIFQVESEMEESRSSETNINEKLDTEGFPQVQNTVVHEESETSESVRRQEMSDTEGVSRLEPGMLAKSIAESIENWVRSMKHTGAGEDSVLSDSFATEGKSGTESAIGGVVVKEGKKCTERLLQVDIDRIANLVQGIESDSGNLQEISASEPCNSGKHFLHMRKQSRRSDAQ